MRLPLIEGIEISSNALDMLPPGDISKWVGARYACLWLRNMDMLL